MSPATSRRVIALLEIIEDLRRARQSLTQFDRRERAQLDVVTGTWLTLAEVSLSDADAHLERVHQAVWLEGSIQPRDTPPATTPDADAEGP